MLQQALPVVVDHLPDLETSSRAETLLVNPPVVPRGPPVTQDEGEDDKEEKEVDTQ